MDKVQEKIDKHYKVMHLGWLLGEARMGRHITTEEFKWLVDEAGREFIEELGYRKPLDRPELEDKIQALLSLRTDVIFAYLDWKITQGEIELFLNDIDNQLLALIPDIPKDKPPLLTQEKMEFILGSVLYDTYGLEPKVRRVRIEQLLQAQRDSSDRETQEKIREINNNLKDDNQFRLSIVSVFLTHPEWQALKQKVKEDRLMRQSPGRSKGKSG